MSEPEVKKGQIPNQEHYGVKKTQQQKHQISFEDFFKPPKKGAMEK